MSGGPVHAIEGDLQREVKDDDLFPIGIIFASVTIFGGNSDQPPSTLPETQAGNIILE